MKLRHDNDGVVQGNWDIFTVNVNGLHQDSFSCSKKAIFRIYLHVNICAVQIRYVASKYNSC